MLSMSLVCMLAVLSMSGVQLAVFFCNFGVGVSSCLALALSRLLTAQTSPEFNLRNPIAGLSDAGTRLNHIGIDCDKRRVSLMAR